jgi:hypothetical protein
MRASAYRVLAGVKRKKPYLSKGGFAGITG